MTPAQVLTITAAGALLLVASTRNGGNVEAGEGDYTGGLDLYAVGDLAESFFNRLTEQSANVDNSTAGRNIAAFLAVIANAEGTAQRGGYRACFGYRHTINDMSNHPAVTGEWRGERLSDAMCANAGFGPGCVSSAAGRYQIIKGTWLKVASALRLPDFGEASQDAAAVELIRRRGALEDVKAGRFAAAVDKCRNEWASLPGNYAKQGQRTMGQLAAWFTNAGGTVA